MCWGSKNLGVEFVGAFLTQVSSLPLDRRSSHRRRTVGYESMSIVQEWEKCPSRRIPLDGICAHRLCGWVRVWGKHLTSHCMCDASFDLAVFLTIFTYE